MQLLPAPQSLSLSEGSLSLSQITSLSLPRLDNPLRQAVQDLLDLIEQLTFERPALNGRGQGILHLKASDDESYSLQVTAEGFQISGGNKGLFYGLQTLMQLIRSCGPQLPLLQINDAPDFAHRGFYHDVTRGKVPTLATLKDLARKLAHYKINQLQLYVEHTFAFQKHCDLWAGSDPLTAEEILELDAFCHDLHIELVPSLRGGCQYSMTS